MRFWCGFFLVFLWAGLSFAQRESPSLGKPAPAFDFRVDEFTAVTVELEHTTGGDPVSYSSHLETDVCSDGLCKPISITVRWDLLGRFLSYHTDERHRLTKFDHIELTEEDHARLHAILSDTSSILRDYEVEDMIDTAVHLQSLKLDAVTGATSKTFDGATVEGALYTVYTLWHFTNGDIRKRILEHTGSLLSDRLVRYLLHSGNRGYVEFALRDLDGARRNRLVADIVGLLGSRDAYIPHFALAQLDDGLLSVPSLQHRVLGHFPEADAALKNALLERFGKLKVDRSGLEMLLSYLKGLGEHQAAVVFSVIENNRAELDRELAKRLETLSKGSDETIARMATKTLRKVR